MNKILDRIKQTNSRFKAGMSLVEVMIAMSVASVLSLGLMELIKHSSVNNQNVASSILWNNVFNEIQLILNTPDACKAIFNSYYPTGNSAPTSSAVTTSTKFPPGTAISIPRPGSTNSFQAGHIEKNASGGGGIKILKVEIQNAVDTANTVTLNVHIQAQRVNSDLSSTAVHYDKVIPVSLRRSDSTTGCPGTACRFNSLSSCTSNFSDLNGRDACATLGGEWREPPPLGEPNCKLVKSLVTPPAQTPILTAAGVYQNLCPAGQAVSGIDLSSGKAVTACTHSNPRANAIASCAGVLSWKTDATPTGGHYECISLPSCVAKQHLTWDGTNFSCTNDELPAAPICTRNQIPVWKGSTWACDPLHTPEEDVGACNGNKFLQWKSGKYECSGATSIGGCDAQSILTWNGNDFQCVHTDASAGGKDIAKQCNTPGFHLVYNTGSHKFDCIPDTPPTPPSPTRYYKSNDLTHSGWNIGKDYSDGHRTITSCPTGTWLNGIYATFTDRLRNIAIWCTDKKGQSSYTGPWLGDLSSDIYDSSKVKYGLCNAGDFVRALKGRFGNDIDKLEIECARQQADGSYNSWDVYTLTLGGGTGGGDFYAPCPPGAVIHELRVGVDTIPGTMTMACSIPGKPGSPP